LTGIFGGGGVQTVQTQNMVDLTLAGNTSGTLALMSSGTVAIAGGNNITLSQNGNAVTISAGASGGAAPTLSIYDNFAGRGDQLSFFTAFNTFALAVLNPAPGNLFPGNFTASTVFLDVSAKISTVIGDASLSGTFKLGIYTLSGSTLSLLNSVSSSYTVSISSTNSQQGAMWVTIHSSQWSANPTFSNTQYWLGYIHNVPVGAINSVSILGISNYATLQRSGTFPNASSAITMGFVPFIGLSSASLASNSPLPASIGLDELSKGGAGGYIVPHLVFMNISNEF